MAPACYRTGGGSLEICREGGEAEGLLHVPGPCAFAREIQILRLAAGERPDPIQFVFQGERPATARRGRAACTERRGLDPSDAGAVHGGRAFEQLATALPTAAPRLWEALTEPARPSRRRGGRRARWSEPPAVPAEAAEETIGPRGAVAVAGREWAGEDYTYVFLLATAGDAGNARRVQIQARTRDFESFEVRARAPDGGGVTWSPFTEPGRRGRRAGAPSPTAVLDEAGKPLIGNCPEERGLDTQALTGSISVVDQTYHFFYTDVLPEDCGAPAGRRRAGLYLRTSRNLAAEQVWSAPRLLTQALPAGTLVRVAKAKGLERWAVAYTCRRPANASGGPVPDICVQYTADLALDGLGALALFSEPVAAGRSSAYLGLRSGGDGSGRYDRSGHFWMTDRYGNLATPVSFATKAGFLTWQDRRAPGTQGSSGSSLYGRPAYWATWTLRPVAPR